MINLSFAGKCSPPHLLSIIWVRRCTIFYQNEKIEYSSVRSQNIGSFIIVCGPQAVIWVLCCNILIKIRADTRMTRQSTQSCALFEVNHRVGWSWELLIVGWIKVIWIQNHNKGRHQKFQFLQSNTLRRGIYGSIVWSGMNLLGVQMSLDNVVDSTILN